MSRTAFFEFLSEVWGNPALAFALTDILCGSDGDALHTVVSAYAQNLGYDVKPADVALFHQRLEIFIKQEGELSDAWLDEISGGVLSSGPDMSSFSGGMGWSGCGHRSIGAAFAS
ncbi:hypothetical protein [Thalassospira tepidiphila]|jgi:hypothetical protein|uniref:hypothetical protein n=1 Tax=Thalassospira tepidiphila TaxID=393657 RepID=UPI001BCAAB8F|nr:hypothetical protein [Thalassospira tepidiphila]